MDTIKERYTESEEIYTKGLWWKGLSMLLGLIIVIIVILAAVGVFSSEGFYDPEGSIESIDADMENYSLQFEGGKDVGYNFYVKQNALEPEVFESQVEYMEDIQGITNSGASHLTETSHLNTVVPFTGLRRIDYGVGAGESARVTHSETHEQMVDENANKNEYVL